MLDDLLANNFLVFTVLVLTAVLLLVESGFLFWRSRNGAQARRLRERLASVNPRHSERSVRQAELAGFDRAVRRLVGTARLERLLEQADLGWPLSGFVSACGVCALLGLALGLEVLTLPLVFAICLGAALSVVPLAYVMRRRGRRMARLERQLPDALDLIARSLRAGHAFSASLKMAGQEMTEPIAGEFRKVHEEVTYGVSQQDALVHLAERVPSTDMRFFVVSVLVQRESGGNLTEILANLSRLVRERLKLLARVRVLSSEGRLSAWILGLMPFALAFVINLFNPKFMGPLWTDPLGITMVKMMLSIMAVGVLILWRIVRIRV